MALQARAIVVRSSGIYGPGRAALWEKFKRGEAVIEGDGSRWMNQIHQIDLVIALRWLAEHGRPGEIYNATDDTPVMQRDYYAWCAEVLKKPLPPYGPVNTAAQARAHEQTRVQREAARDGVDAGLPELSGGADGRPRRPGINAV